MRALRDFRAGKPAFYPDQSVYAEYTCARFDLAFRDLDGGTGLLFSVTSKSKSVQFGAGRCSWYPQNNSTAATLASDKYFASKILEDAGIANPVIALVVLALIAGYLLRWTRWGRHVFAIGGNEQAAILAGVRVRRIKVGVYMLSALTAGITGVLEVGWLGAVTTNLGQSMELAVIAAAVIGGANLSGGVGTAFGAVIGAALIEIIRNSLLLLGVDAFWQGTFVGSFIVLAVMFDRLKGSRLSE